MILFNFKKKLDPMVRLKLKEKSDKTIPVIICLKEPLSNRLKNSISKNRGKIKYEYKYINSISIEAPLDEIDKLSELPEVLYISYDRKANICMDTTSASLGINPAKPFGLTGKGVTTAIIDTGVYPHADLIRPYRVVTFFKDFVNSYGEAYDDNGHGTFMCGVLAGSGSLSEGRYRGIAPNSKIIMLKAFDNVGEGSFSHILSAVGWVIENMEKYNIKILLLPFGADSIVPFKEDPLCMACEAAWNKGIIVIAPSGNKGPYPGTITTPGIDPHIITVGCCNGKNPNGKLKVSNFSGRGSKKDKDTKPEIVAPGVNITSLSSDRGFIPDGSRRIKSSNLDIPYISMTGSSVSAAVAAGCIALLLEKMPNVSIHDLKGILKLGCESLNEEKISQGHGLLNMEKLSK